MGGLSKMVYFDIHDTLNAQVSSYRCILITTGEERCDCHDLSLPRMISTSESICSVLKSVK